MLTFFLKYSCYFKLEIVPARNAIEERTHGRTGLSQQQFCSDGRFSFLRFLREEMAVYGVSKTKTSKTKT